MGEDKTKTYSFAAAQKRLNGIAKKHQRKLGKMFYLPSVEFEDGDEKTDKIKQKIGHPALKPDALLNMMQVIFDNNGSYARKPQYDSAGGNYYLTYKGRVRYRLSQRKDIIDEPEKDTYREMPVLTLETVLPKDKVLEDLHTQEIFYSMFLKMLEKEDDPNIKTPEKSLEKLLEYGATVKQGKELVTMEAIYGYDRVKKQMFQRIINTNRQANEIDEKRLEVMSHQKVPYNNFLFIGPYGVGKTEYAQAIAHALGKTYVEVDTSNIFGMYVGQSGKNIEAIFNHVFDHGNAVLFLDEFDTIFAQTHDGINSTENKVRGIIQTKLVENKRGRGTPVIMATNHPELLNHAFHRRIRSIRIPLPNQNDLLEIYQGMAKHLSEDDHKKLVQFSKGKKLSGSDIMTMINTAIDLRFEEDPGELISVEDIEQAYHIEKENAMVQEKGKMGFGG